MFKTAAQVTLAGAAGLLVMKFLGLLVVPVVGIVLGVFSMLFKVALVIVVGYVVLSLFKRFRDGNDDEVEVEVE